MADLDVLGPGAAGAPRALPSSDPSITSTIQFPDASDTWFGDCVSNTAGTGTPYVSEWANRNMQQVRRVIRNSGIALPYADDQLGYAIQQGLQWVGTFGGSANAVTGTMVPAAATLIAGTEIKGLVSATNTGPATLNVNGIGAFPITGADGTHLIGGEMVIGGVASLIYTGTAFMLLSIGPSIFQRVISTNTTFNVDNSIGNDTTGDGSAGAPWFSITHAQKVTSTFNLGGNAVTIQLGNTGVTYVGPGAFAAPSNGPLFIRGNPASQASYNIALSAAGVIAVNSGAVTLVGLTINNTSSVGSSVVSATNGAQLSIQNVTILSSFSSSNGALISANVAGNVTVLSGCIMAGNANYCWLASATGSIVQGANVALSGSRTFLALVSAQFFGLITQSTTGWSWTGTTPTCVRSNANTNGIVNSGTGSPNTFWPGSSVSTTATQGQTI